LTLFKIAIEGIRPQLDKDVQLVIHEAGSSKNSLNLESLIKDCSPNMCQTNEKLGADGEKYFLIKIKKKTCRF
jgi:hypothetical protein